MDLSVKKKIKKNIKTTLKNVLPYGIATHIFPEKKITEGNPPSLYNEKGERVLVAYLQDYHVAHSPYTFVSGRLPKRILWDRFNYRLNTQFYSHQEIFKLQEKNDGQRQFGILVESENVVPDDYERLIKNPDAVKRLDALFTHSDRLLDKYENAFFIPGGGSWFGTPRRGGVLTDQAFYNKSKLISIVSSIKFFRPLSTLRSELALEMAKIGLGDVMGTIVGKYVSIADSLTDYMYSVGIENTASKYYFTEKLINCFAAMAVPVYYGASEVTKFFNPDGIILIKEPTVECAIDTIKRNCSREDYESRKEAIIDNYNRVQNYLCIEDYLTANYMNKFVF